MKLPQTAQLSGGVAQHDLPLGVAIRRDRSKEKREKKASENQSRCAHERVLPLTKDKPLLGALYHTECAVWGLLSGAGSQFVFAGPPLDIAAACVQRVAFG
jgi:hypothetical protein